MHEKILVVDDEPNVLKCLTEVLTKEGYDVTTATDGEVGLEYIKNVEFDLLLTDIKIPKMSGEILLSKSKEIRPDLMAIVITGYGSRDLAIRCVRENKAFDFVNKPFRVEELLLSVEKVINIKNLKHLPGKIDSSLEELLKAGDPSAFTPTARLALKDKIIEYSHELVDLTLKISKRNYAGSASKAYVNLAGYQIANTTDSRLFKHLGIIGGILLGAFLSGFVAMTIDCKFTMITTIVSTLFGVLGAFLIAFPIVHDLRK